MHHHVLLGWCDTLWLVNGPPMFSMGTESAWRAEVPSPTGVPESRRLSRCRRHCWWSVSTTGACLLTLRCGSHSRPTAAASASSLSSISWKRSIIACCGESSRLYTPCTLEFQPQNPFRLPPSFFRHAPHCAYLDDLVVEDQV